MPSSSKIYSVAELTVAIKKQLESAYPSVCVKGEISNFKLQSSGHLYFTLKDERAQISCALFKGDAQGLKRLPKEGDKVLAQGEVSVYPPRGNYQLIVRSLQFEGIGELLMKFQELKERLQKRGWFDSAHKKPLPPFPKTIGVVTSPTGAVIQDIVHVLTRRFSGFHLLLNPVKVQGEGAAQEIARAIDEMNRYALADLLIVGRGGGSLEDLFAFNEEIVAEAIFHSKIPVISAVGHETDVTLADYVADVRAPTPSAAAEIALFAKSEQLNRLRAAKQSIRQLLSALLEKCRLRLHGLLVHPSFSSPFSLVTPYAQILDDVTASLDAAIRTRLLQAKMSLLAAKREAAGRNPRQNVKEWKERFYRISQQIFHRIQESVVQRKERLAAHIRHLHAVDPRTLLTRGYSLLFTEKRDSVIVSASQVKKGESLFILMHDGEICSNVDEVTLGKR